LGSTRIPLLANVAYAPVISMSDNSTEPRAIEGDLGILLSIPADLAKRTTFNGVTISINLADITLIDFAKADLRVISPPYFSPEFLGVQASGIPNLPLGIV